MVMRMTTVVTATIKMTIQVMLFSCPVCALCFSRKKLKLGKLKD